MIRKLSGLNINNCESAPELNGFFLVKVENASYRWHPQKPFLMIRFAILQPEGHRDQAFSGRIYCSQRALWRLSWFLRDFGYDQELLAREQLDEKALANLKGIVRTSVTRFRGGFYQTLEGFAPAADWEHIPQPQQAEASREIHTDDL